MAGTFEGAAIGSLAKPGTVAELRKVTDEKVVDVKLMRFSMELRAFGWAKQRAYKFHAELDTDQFEGLRSHFHSP